MKIKIKENALLARLAAYNLKSSTMAITVGRTIYLHNATKKDLLSSERWLRHELKHVEQFLRYGFFWFLLLYTIESIRKGYYHNKFELEARAAETEITYLERYIVL
ncbi:DUF4157 domain-containing protein [Taibaiella sp. KBW10]|uniref:eCIS core domain-containing protein n=1 Tax=Taibaiella sp. KBW10 TaxID=2153357 RepID=UPI000F5A6A69|nr:DUF4157 domain-containing protein [Taibaiella sp. KBW10]RQO32376.1 DUF4157 domain-containing protein [Taibaiella sp. KBW10]